MCEERLVKYMCTSKLSDSNVFFFRWKAVVGSNNLMMSVCVKRILNKRKIGDLKNPY